MRRLITSTVWKNNRFKLSAITTSNDSLVLITHGAALRMLRESLHLCFNEEDFATLIQLRTGYTYVNVTSFES